MADVGTGGGEEFLGAGDARQRFKLR